MDTDHCPHCPRPAHGVPGSCPGQARPELCRWGKEWAEGRCHDGWILFLLGAGLEPGSGTPSCPPSLPLAGDLIKAASRRLGADRLARWVAARLGVDCGCEERRLRINALDAKLRKYLGLGG